MESPVQPLCEEETSKSIAVEMAEKKAIKDDDKDAPPPVQEYQLTNMSLLDVLTVCQNDPVLREVVGDFFHFAKSGHDIPVRIDDAFLRQYPLARHRFVYKDLGENTHALTLCNVQESDAHQLFVYFRNTTTLTLQDMQIRQTNKFHFFPCSRLRALTLINCHVSREFLAKWLAKMHRTLESVSLDRVIYEFPVPGELSFIFALPKLRQLSIQGMRMDKFDLAISSKSPLEELTLKLDTRSINIRASDGNRVRRLDIEASDMFLSGELSQLQYLSLRCGHGRSKRDHLSSLQCVHTLTTLIYDIPLPHSTSITHLLRFKNLKHLKVHCNWYEADEWRDKLTRSSSSSGNNPNQPSIELICHPPTLGFCFSMPDDLLLKIMAYLSIEDFFNLGAIYPPYLTLLDATRCLTIDQAFLNKHPLADESFYQYLGQGVRILKVSAIKEEKDFQQLMCIFSNIRELRLEGMALKDVDGVGEVPKVSALSIGYCPAVDRDYWTALFKRLNETLTSLTVEEPTQYPILELQKLKECSCESYACAETMSGFLQQNKQTLKGLRLSSHRSRDAFLELTLEEKLELETVHFTVNRFEQIGPVWTALDPHALRCLEVTSYTGKGQLIAPLTSFVGLQQLSLDIAVDWSQQNLTDLAAFVNLNSLRINGQVTEAVVFEMVAQHLPRLDNLDLGSQVEPFTCGFEEKLRKYLEDKDRVLIMNKGDSVGRWVSNAKQG